MNNGDSWSYVSSVWSTDTKLFKPSKNGNYLFMVEARRKGRTTADETAVTTNKVNVNLYGIPVVTVELNDMPSNIYNAGDGIELIATAKDDNGESIDKAYYEFYYQIEGSTKMYLIQKNSDDNTAVFTPMKDDDYKFIVRSRTYLTSAIADTDETEFIDVSLMPEPIDSVELELEEADTPGDPDIYIDTVDLTAQAIKDSADVADGDAEYVFYYKSDTDENWYLLGDGYSTENEVTFTPLESGMYQFIVQARKTGRDEYDAYAISDYVQVTVVEVPTGLMEELEMIVPECLDEIPEELLETPDPSAYTEPTPEPTEEPEPTPEDTPEPTPTVEPEPTPEPTDEEPEPTVEPTPTSDATEEPEPTPEPTGEPEPTETPEPTPKPTPEPTPEPESTPTAEDDAA